MSISHITFWILGWCIMKVPFTTYRCPLTCGKGVVTTLISEGVGVLAFCLLKKPCPNGCAFAFFPSPLQQASNMEVQGNPLTITDPSSFTVSSWSTCLRRQGNDQHRMREVSQTTSTQCSSWCYHLTHRCHVNVFNFENVFYFFLKTFCNHYLYYLGSTTWYPIKYSRCIKKMSM